VQRADRAEQPGFVRESAAAESIIVKIAAAPINYRCFDDDPWAASAVFRHSGDNHSSSPTKINPLVTLRRLHIALPIALSLSAGCLPDRAPLSIRLIGPGTSTSDVTVSAQDTRTIVDIRGGGIGTVELSRSDAAWPEPIVLRLHLSGLESLNVDNGTIAIGTSVLSRSPPEQVGQLLPGSGRASTNVTPDSPFWMPLRIIGAREPGAPAVPLAEGYFEVTLPDILFDESTNRLIIRWVDFFR
jgi:hypothetical protein